VLGHDRHAPTDPATGGDHQAAIITTHTTTNVAVVAGVFDRLAGAQGLTARASTFARPEVIAALGEQLVGAGRAELEGLADRFLEQRAVSVVADCTLEERRWSTPELLESSRAWSQCGPAAWRTGRGVCARDGARGPGLSIPRSERTRPVMLRGVTLSPDGGG
jgi:hypothetical protein